MEKRGNPDRSGGLTRERPSLATLCINSNKMIRLHINLLRCYNYTVQNRDSVKESSQKGTPDVSQAAVGNRVARESLRM